MPTHIRLANPKDAPAITAVHIRSWQKIYRGYVPDAVLDNLCEKERGGKWLELLNNQVNIWVIEENDVIVGFASICPARHAGVDSATCGEISAIYLHPDVWHKGLGTQLCQKALLELQKMGFSDVILWVLSENNQAREFYKTMGFTETGEQQMTEYAQDVFLKEVRYRRPLKK